jgi:hypothetical protein
MQNLGTRLDAPNNMWVRLGEFREAPTYNSGVSIMWVVNIKFVNHSRAFVAKIAHVCFFIVCGFP